MIGSPVTALLLIVSCFLPSALADLARSGDGYTLTGRVKIDGGLGSKGFGLPAKISNTKVLLNGGQRVSFIRPDGSFSLYPYKLIHFPLYSTGWFFFIVTGDSSELRMIGWPRNRPRILHGCSIMYGGHHGFLYAVCGDEQAAVPKPLDFFIWTIEDVSAITLGFFDYCLSYNVPAGTHLIEVAALGYFFSPVRVDISARNPGKIQAALTENRRALHELILEPLREEQYYEVREPFSIMSLVKSPMGLMVGFMLLMVFVMPKLMENMDPEEMRRAQEEMRSQGGLAGMLSGAARSN